jgi:hypothetical protein
METHRHFVFTAAVPRFNHLFPVENAKQHLTEEAVEPNTEEQQTHTRSQAIM